MQRLTCSLAILLALASCTRSGAQIQNQPDDGQWTMPAKNYASTRFSTLDQINTANVSNLKLSWTFSTGLTRGHEAAPLIVNNTMYILI
jgi:alcohol dehydrogenase (cytochrome c)